MCVAIYIPAGATVAENILRGVFKRNDDGVGVAWSDGQKLDIWRTMNDINGVVTLVQNLRDYPTLVHFRYATHGTVTMDNVHPFWLDERRRAVVAHNGVIQIGTANDESDTRAFVRHVLGQMRDGWWNNPVTMTQIEKLLNGSRIIIMEDDGRAHILNKHAGDVSADKVWFSNSQWKEFVSPDAKNMHASMISAETGERKPYVHGYNNAQNSAYGSQSDFWNKHGATEARDPFNSAPKTTAAASEPAKTSTKSTSAGGKPITPNASTPSSSSSTNAKQTTPPSSSSSTSTTGTPTSTPTTEIGSDPTTTGPVKQSEVAGWIEAFGQLLVTELPVGYASMPDGAYGDVVCHCPDCVPSYIEDGRADFSATLTAIDLLDSYFHDRVCLTCQVPLYTAAREVYHDAEVEDAAEREAAALEEEAEENWLDTGDLPPAHAQADGASSPTTTEEQNTALVSGSALADFPYHD